LPRADAFDTRLFLSGALAFFASGMMPPLYGVTLPLWSEAFGLGEGEGGWLLAANGAGSFLAVLAGFLGVSGLGIRTGLAGLVLGTVILGLSSSWGMALAGAFVTGLGFGVLMAAVNRGFLAGFGARGPGMVGLVNAIYGFGAIVSPLAFLATGSRPTLAFAGVTALAAVALSLARPEPEPTRRGLPDLRDRRLLVTLFIFGNGLIEGLSVGFGASALVGTGLGEETAAGLTSGFFMAYLAARLALTWLAGRFPPDVLFLIGTGGAGLAMATAALGAPALGYVAAGAFVGMIFPSYYVWAMRILGPDPRMTSAILTAGLLGGLLSPIAVQPILARAGEEAVLSIVAVAGLAVAGIFALLRTRTGRLALP
jgi:fucose permease